eukprot:TRINITY_DN10041_c0_g2_i1.p1 TRINITY_DN10041_c0_g2~~TRINITY_DN10041_c0_g2_i1.p1  ORF type:complete len:378 (-),score=46.19 TRINITY_DN10041_c0_g2_i1:69-1202(-)
MLIGHRTVAYCGMVLCVCILSWCFLTIQLHQATHDEGLQIYTLQEKQYQRFDYHSKVGRGGCAQDKLLANEDGFENEADVQERCSQLLCAFYIWSNDPADSRGTAWLCSAGEYDTIKNADEFPLWKVGRRNIEYQSKVGRGGCEDANLIANEVGFTDEVSAQERCAHYFCNFYIWSNDSADLKGSAWFCNYDTYDTSNNANAFPLWRVGRPKVEYESKAGNGGCDAGNLIADEVGFKDEASVQERCTQHCCRSYIWSSDPRDAAGTARFCRIRTYDITQNEDDFTLRKVGQPKSKYQSKVGRGGCAADQLLANEVDFPDEHSVQERCSHLSCTSYIWSNDPADVKGTAWFCSEDVFDGIHNANDFPLWKVGRNSRHR